MKLSSYKSFFTNVNRKIVYFMCVRLETRKTKLKQQVIARLATKNVL